jgi:putative intracellular protease/amidase
MTDEATRGIGILLFPGAEELDAIGPWEVLSHWTRNFPEGGWGVFCFSADGKPVTCAKRLTIESRRSMSPMPALDVLLHPGGQGTRCLLDDPGIRSGSVPAGARSRWWRVCAPGCWCSRTQGC